LSNLLAAEDGTGNTLVVRSLTDGVMEEDALSVTIATTAANAAQTAAGAAAPTAAQQTALGFTAGVADAAGRYDAAFVDVVDGAGRADLTGADSEQANSNTIDAGAGTDTVILGTSGTSEETVDVADGEADVVFNASNGSSITVDILDTVISSSGVIIAGGAGAVAVGVAGEIVGTAGDDTINGGFGNDTISGGAGNDTITGGDGVDIITGGTGVDTVTGGDGIDTFVFATGDTGITVAAADTITDFTSGIDSIDVSDAAILAGVAIADGALNTGLADFIVDADAALTGGSGVYAEYGINGTTTGYAIVDENGDGVVSEGDTLLVLNGVAAAPDIAALDFI
jgi:Ca2+-binding RTX toxin-like protein